jgi:SAM-dependent methyltransferase
MAWGKEEHWDKVLEGVDRPVSTAVAILRLLLVAAAAASAMLAWSAWTEPTTAGARLPVRLGALFLPVACGAGFLMAEAIYRHRLSYPLCFGWDKEGDHADMMQNVFSLPFVAPMLFPPVFCLLASWTEAPPYLPLDPDATTGSIVLVYFTVAVPAIFAGLAHWPRVLLEQRFSALGDEPEDGMRTMRGVVDEKSGQRAPSAGFTIVTEDGKKVAIKAGAISCSVRALSAWTGSGKHASESLRHYVVPGDVVLVRGCFHPEKSMITGADDEPTVLFACPAGSDPLQVLSKNVWRLRRACLEMGLLSLCAVACAVARYF